MKTNILFIFSLGTALAKPLIGMNNRVSASNDMESMETSKAEISPEMMDMHENKTGHHRHHYQEYQPHHGHWHEHEGEHRGPLEEGEPCDQPSLAVPHRHYESGYESKSGLVGGSVRTLPRSAHGSFHVASEEMEGEENVYRRDQVNPVSQDGRDEMGMGLDVMDMVNMGRDDMEMGRHNMDVTHMGRDDMGVGRVDMGMGHENMDMVRMGRDDMERGDMASGDMGVGRNYMGMGRKDMRMDEGHMGRYDMDMNPSIEDWEAMMMEE